MTEQDGIQRFTTRAIAVFVMLFSIWFVFSQWGGLARMVEWAISAVTLIPAGFNYFVAYYGALPAAPLILSLAIGSVAGLVTGVAIGPRRNARTRRSPGLILRSALVGLVGGLIGSQVLPYALRHCTYLPEAPPVEALIGAFLTACGAILSAIVLAGVIRSRRPRSFAYAGYFRSIALPYVLLAPTLIGLLFFLYYPSVQTLLFSLNARRAGLPQERFVCLRNYTNLASDVLYQNSFVTSLFITLAVVLISMAAALGIATLASQKIRGASIYRTLIVFPFALSPVVTGTIFLSMFRQGGGGLVNYLLGTDLNWLNDVALARYVVVFASVWNILGFNALFYIAGLQNMPKDLLEAAAIDGANRLRRFVRIIFPLLAPYSFFLLITNVTYAFYGVYGAVDTLTQGGPPLGAAGSLGGATNVLIYKLYSDAFGPGSPFGSASAQAVILFLFVAALTLLQFRTIESQITYSDQG